MTHELVTKLLEWIDKLDHAAEESCYEGYSSGMTVKSLIDNVTDEMREALGKYILLE